MSSKLWEKVESSALKKGIFQKGGYMDIKEHFRQEGRQEGMLQGRREGRQKERQQVILNMLKEKFDISVISKATGLSEKEIKKLKNGSK